MNGKASSLGIISESVDLIFRAHNVAEPQLIILPPLVCMVDNSQDGCIPSSSSLPTVMQTGLIRPHDLSPLLYPPIFVFPSLIFN